MFIGNQKAVKFLEKCLKRGIVAQSYLFSGPESVGKFTLAKNFAKCLINSTGTTLLYSNVADADFDSKKIILDLIIIEPEREEKKGITKEKDIKIENVRDAQKELTLFPYQGKYKVLIINNAHRMTEEAQNALLKILEEPNTTSVIILVTSEENKILSTLKSRCQKIRFNCVSAEEIKKFLAKEKISAEVISLSFGKPGLALIMEENEEELDFRRQSLGDLKEIQKAGINQRLKMAEELARNVPRAVQELEFWTQILHDKTKEVKNQTPVFTLFGIIEKIEKCLWAIKNTNANSRLILENLLLNL